MQTREHVVNEVQRKLAALHTRFVAEVLEATRSAADRIVIEGVHTAFSEAVTELLLNGAALTERAACTVRE